VVGIGDGVINFVNKMERGIADGVGGALTQKAAASLAFGIVSNATTHKGFDGHPPRQCKRSSP
jgi:hypothetical protein